MKQRIVFLDFDGVLNSETFLREVWTAKKAGDGPVYRSIHTDEISPEMAKRVEELCERAGAQVVISSTWRILHSLEEIQAMLIEVGAPKLAARIIGQTPVSKRQRFRGAEIQEWLERCGRHVTEYVIIDDDSDMLPEQCRNFVQTHWSTGIMDDHVEQAVMILGGA